MKRTITVVLVSVAALAVAGAATAGISRMITGKDVKNSSLTGADIQNSSLTGADIKNGSIAPSDLSSAARGTAGPAGPAGPAGAPGPKGDSGTVGAPGTSASAAPALIMGAGGVFEAGGGEFHPPLGGQNSGSETAVQVPVPVGAALTARDFSARVDLAPGVGQSVVVALRINGLDTVISCTISGTATTCTPAGSPTLVLPAGGLMSMRSTESAATPSQSAAWSFRVVL